MNQIKCFCAFMFSVAMVAVLADPCAALQYDNSTINLQKRIRPKATISMYKSLKTSIKAESRQAGGVIRIGDIARVVTKDKQLAAKIEALDIDRWPAPGTEIVIPRSQLQVRARLAGFSTRDVYVSGSDGVTIIGAGDDAVDVDAAFESNPFTQQLLQVVIDAAKTRYDVDQKSITVEVLGAPILPAELDIEAPELGIDVISNGGQLIGKQTVDLLVSDGRLTRRVKLPLSILIAKEVAVTSSIVRTGDVFSKANVRLQKTHFASADIDDSIGIDAFGSFSARTIRRNQMLRFSDLGKAVTANQGRNNEIVVKRGDLVTAKFKRKTIELNLAGVKTLQSGKIGQLIQVERQDNGRTFAARVISSTEVEAR